jgi:hypothetical protein
MTIPIILYTAKKNCITVYNNGNLFVRSSLPMCRFNSLNSEIEFRCKNEYNRKRSHESHSGTVSETIRNQYVNKHENLQVIRVQALLLTRIRQVE